MLVVIWSFCLLSVGTVLTEGFRFMVRGVKVENFLFQIELVIREILQLPGLYGFVYLSNFLDGRMDAVGPAASDYM